VVRPKCTDVVLVVESARLNRPHWLRLWPYQLLFQVVGDLREHFHWVEKGEGVDLGRRLVGAACRTIGRRAGRIPLGTYWPLSIWVQIGAHQCMAAVLGKEGAVSYWVLQRRHSSLFAGLACTAWGAAVRWAARGRRLPALSSIEGGRT